MVIELASLFILLHQFKHLLWPWDSKKWSNSLHFSAEIQHLVRDNWHKGTNRLEVVSQMLMSSLREIATGRLSFVGQTIESTSWQRPPPSHNWPSTRPVDRAGTVPEAAVDTSGTLHSQKFTPGQKNGQWSNRNIVSSYFFVSFLTQIFIVRSWHQIS